MAIRACSADWVYAPTDLDTLNNRAYFPPPPDGDITTASDFPITAADGQPTDFPITWRADDVTSVRDPRPVNVSVSAAFFTGTVQSAVDEASADYFTLYFREIPVDDQIQLELDSKTMEELDTLGHQPDFGTAQFIARTQSELDIYTQDELGDETQAELESLPDVTPESWIEVHLSWYSSIGAAPDAKLWIHNADGLGYEYIIADTFDIESSYVMIVDLEDETIRVRIYALDEVGNVGSLLFETPVIQDDTVIKRREGRFGWHSRFTDGDAYLANIRTRGLHFGEIITKPYQSHTPVKGAQIFAGSSPDLQLFTTLFEGPWGVGTVDLDPTASSSGKALKITNSAGEALQGIQTNDFILDQLRDTSISFGLKYPTNGPSLAVFLLGEFDRVIPLKLTPFQANQWTRVRASIPNDLLQTGTYALCLVQTLAETETTWWIDGVSIKTPVLKWSARGQKADPWNLTGDDWVPAKETLNELYGGVIFEERGKGLQIRGEAIRQNAEIRDFKIIPKYADLGNFRWQDEIPDRGAPPTAFIDLDQQGSSKAVTFSGLESDDGDNSIIHYFWSFGDGGKDAGPVVVHEYAEYGNYTANLTVVDALGNRDTVSTSFNISD
jgi:hypothetical protein